MQCFFLFAVVGYFLFSLFIVCCSLHSVASTILTVNKDYQCGKWDSSLGLTCTSRQHRSCCSRKMRIIMRSATQKHRHLITRRALHPYLARCGGCHDKAVTSRQQHQQQHEWGRPVSAYVNTHQYTLANRLDAPPPSVVRRAPVINH